MKKSELRQMIRELYQELNEKKEPYLPLSKDRYYLDTRTNKVLQIFSVDGDSVWVQYYDFKTKKPTKTAKFTKGEVDYWIDRSAWKEWKQKFREEI